MKTKHKSLKSLRRKLWKLVSEYVRRSTADEKGYVACYTCGVKKHWRDLACGHYVHKNCLDFEVERNLRPQCVKCNNYLSGNSGVYAEKLIQEIGLEEVLKLRQLVKEDKKFNITELEDMIATYTEAVKCLNQQS